MKFEFLSLTELRKLLDEKKVSSVEHYDQVILLMQGEIVATGTHDELIKSSPEYVQILQSQQSTSNYEL